MSHELETAYYHLCNIARFELFCSHSDIGILIRLFISSKLDHCNFLLSFQPHSSTKSLQLVQNTAVRIQTSSRKFEDITMILIFRHWLSIHVRANLKVLHWPTKLCLQQHCLSALIKPYTVHCEQVLLTPVTYPFQSVSLPWCFSWEHSSHLH